MNATISVQEVVSAEKGVIIVRLTFYDSNGSPLPPEEQPKMPYQVWLVTGPDRVMLKDFVGIDEAVSWVKNHLDYFLLAEHKVADESLVAAFDAKKAMDAGNDWVNFNASVANIAIIGRFGNPLGKQFVNRWVLCNNDAELTPLIGFQAHSIAFKHLSLAIAIRHSDESPAPPVGRVGAISKPVK